MLIDTIDQVVNEIVTEKIGFIKIDVEGFEHSVLKGGEKTIMKHQPIMYIELDDENLKENGSSASILTRYLHSLGYNDIYRAEDGKKIEAIHDLRNCHFDIIARCS